MDPTATSPLPLPKLQKRRRAELENNLNELHDRGIRRIDCEDEDLVPAVQQDRTPNSSLTRAELTTKNLLAHTQLENPGADIIVPSASATENTAASKSRANDEQALREFGVRFRTDIKPPLELAKHVKNLVERERGEKSPTAKHLAKIYPSASRANKSTMMCLVAPYLLFEDMLHRGGGEHHIVRKDNINFDPQWVTKGNKKLATPRPDVTIGYILHRDTCGLTKALFDLDEETVLLRYAVNKDILSPFITSQLRSAFRDIPTAEIQTTSDGIAIIHAMLATIQAAGECPTPVDLHHWSVACDGSIAHLYLHWGILEDDFGIRHYMMRYLSTALDRDNEQLDRMRMCLRNILDFAREGRVSRLKEIVKKIRNKESGASHASFSDPGFIEDNEISAPTTPRRASETLKSQFKPSQSSPGRSAKKSRLDSPKTPKGWYDWDGLPDELAEER